MSVSFKVVPVKIPEGANVIIGRSHFIKTVEDIYEVLVTSVPGIKFGLAFNEASGKRLVRYEGNDEELTRAAVDAALSIGAGHTFVLFIRNAYPINVLNQLKSVQEVVSIYVATGNPVQVIVAETDQGRAVVGVVDGYTPLGVEGDEDKKERHGFLRKIGYKK
ncbi:Adenosine_kin domain containing protein [Thermogladius calderae 1633]|uniref:Adenosine_kin domain containing protein n=1 Tax=Thermogladius calderae (strain DSM 22663 / VKM B-2946 / 1633) TaxID=1184251 RepID=I3TG51_THEC1|nr:adenosine-specific kinase [Thermogladius calderae]AFK51739.1 Adenosine_kin domain containing protein [Thermogladius calderae 1633]